jgi:hypothetical protein
MQRSPHTWVDRSPLSRFMCLGSKFACTHLHACTTCTGAQTRYSHTAKHTHGRTGTLFAHCQTHDHAHAHTSRSSHTPRHPSSLTSRHIRQVVIPDHLRIRDTIEQRIYETTNMGRRGKSRKEKVAPMSQRTVLVFDQGFSTRGCHWIPRLLKFG